MEAWRDTWRRAWTLALSTAGLSALRDALASNDARLLQGETLLPLPLTEDVEDWPVEQACAGAYCGWVGEGLTTVGAVNDYFAALCFDVDNRLGEAAGCRHFLWFWDDTPRPEAIRLLLPEVERELERRTLPTGSLNAGESAP